MIRKIRTSSQRDGFTLVELIIATSILAITFVGILTIFIRCMELSEYSRKSSMALSRVQSRMEEIKNSLFSQIIANFHNATFTNANLNGIGVSYVTTVNPKLLHVTITFCWRQASGRIIGEDTNLNGVLNAGEDTNVNGILDSNVQIVSYIYDRT